MKRFLLASCALVFAHAANAGTPVLTDMLIFSADATGHVVPGHGADTRLANLYDIFVSKFVPDFTWESCLPHSCDGALNLVNPNVALQVPLVKGDNRFRFFTNLPFPSYANPDAIKTYQISFYFNNSDYLAGAPPALAAYVDQDGRFHLYSGPISDSDYGPFAAGSGSATARISGVTVTLRSLIFRWDWSYHEDGIGYLDLYVK